MDSRDGLQVLRDTVAKAKDDGSQSMQLDILLQVLDELLALPDRHDPETELARKNILGQLEIEIYKADHAAALSTQALNHESALEAFRSTIAAGTIARKDILWINGGASVAILALFGHFVSSSNVSAIPGFIPSITAFVTGVVAAVLTSGLTYLSQWGYQQDEIRWKKRTAVSAHIGALSAWIVSCSAFAAGAFLAARAFMSLA